MSGFDSISMILFIFIIADSGIYRNYFTLPKTAIATSRKFKSTSVEQKEEVCFADIIFFGRSTEVANQYLRKGSKILVEGRLIFDQWVDQNGQKRSKHSVAVESMQMLDSKGTSPNTNNMQNTHQEPNTYVPQQQAQSI